ncbi:hypothetical protein T484DRAFT_1922072, partial [Baffinella frigidus]
HPGGRCSQQRRVWKRPRTRRKGCRRCWKLPRGKPSLGASREATPRTCAGRRRLRALSESWNRRRARTRPPPTATAPRPRPPPRRAPARGSSTGCTSSVGARPSPEGSQRLPSCPTRPTGSRSGKRRLLRGSRCRRRCLRGRRTQGTTTSHPNFIRTGCGSAALRDCHPPSLVCLA